MIFSARIPNSQIMGFSFSFFFLKKKKMLLFNGDLNQKINVLFIWKNSCSLLIFSLCLFFFKKKTNVPANAWYPLSQPTACVMWTSNIFFFFKWKIFPNEMMKFPSNGFIPCRLFHVTWILFLVYVFDTVYHCSICA